jgi:PAS domain S-box-containing protein
VRRDSPHRRGSNPSDLTSKLELARDCEQSLIVRGPRQPAESVEEVSERAGLGGESMLVPATEAFAFVREVKDYAIYMIDPEGRVLTWNEGARAIKGYEPAEIIGQSFNRFFTEEDVAAGRPSRLLERARTEGRVEDEATRVRKDGTRFWADVVITAVHAPAGELLGFVKVTRDLTERRNALELLRESEERMRLLVSSVKDYAIFMLDPEGKITTWNAGAQRIKGYSAREIVGRHFSLFYPPEVVAAGHPAFELEVAARLGSYEEEGWRVRKDGTRFWANVVITAIRDEATNLRGFAKVTRDLTERRRMQEETRSAVAQADEAKSRADAAQTELRQRDEFISVAAHELRTPLTALSLKLQGAVALLKRENAPQAAQQVGDRIAGAQRQADRLTELVERLLDVSRIVRGGLTMNVDDADFASILRHVADDFREPAGQVGSEIVLEGPTVLPGRWDRSRLEQVVANLLGNAVKYGAGKPVRLALSETADLVRLRVVDEGIGIAGEDVDRIFTRFERAAPTRHYAGLGLGLYITKSIVEAHGGTIRVSSAPGAGATFTVELPRYSRIVA